MWTIGGRERIDQRHMIKLPALQHLHVLGYGLFPGEPRGSGIVWDFPAGLTLIAGINGLGKTTLLTMILRSFTGPYDLTSDGAPGSLSVIVPENPTELRGRALSFFAQRVADAGRNASMSLSAKIGHEVITMVRRLDNLSLISCEVNGVGLELPQAKAQRETMVQQTLACLMGVGNFVDVLLLLHHVILFHEDRPGALWDPNAQRQVLRALFLESKDAVRVAELERSLQSADSQARNIHARITATEGDLREARRREAGSKGVIAQLEAEQKLLDAEVAEAARLDAVLAQLDTDRQEARLEMERAKVEREDASGAMERLKYTALLRLFPTMDDAARLVVSRIMTETRCLVCNADARAKRAELDDLIAKGCCPACGAPPDQQENVHPQHEFEQAKLDQAKARVELTRKEEDARRVELDRVTAAYKGTLDELVRLRRSIEDRKQRDRRLRSQLPQSTTSIQFENALKALRTQHQEWLTKRAMHFADLRTLLDSKEDRITSQSAELTATFAELTRELLSEEARLAPITAEPRYLQAPGKAEDRLRVPAYAAEMTAADRPGYIRRTEPSDVSESQRELIDLAFRLALVKAATRSGSCTFVMETPEASLDGVAMDRVGHALARFAATEDNRLVVTSNLSNAGLITALFGGATKDVQEVRAREARIINLLQVAAPNRALLNDGVRYQALLTEALTGQTNDQ
jgi:hypothetical protein